MAKKYRIGGGLQIVEYGYLMGPVRDPKAPRMSSCLDISSGLMEPDEGMKSTQVREGAEEIVRMKDGTVYLPDIVKHTEVIEHVTSTIAEAIEDENSPFEHGFELKFFSSEARTPTGTQEVWIQGHSIHDWETGVTTEEENSFSYELLNYLIEKPSDDLNPIDTEVIEQENGENIWLNRFVYKFHPIKGDAELYKSGEEVFSGSFSSMVEYIEEEFGEELGFTPKVRAAIIGLPPEEGKIYDIIELDKEVARFFNLDNYTSG